MSTDSKNSDLLQIDIFEVLRRRFPLIILGSIAGIGLAAAYCFTAKTRFESNGVVMVMPKDARVTSANASGDSLGMQANVGEELLATHMQIMTSPTVIRKALLAEDQAGGTFIERESLKSQLSAVSGLEVDSPLFRKSAVQYIKKNLSVSRGGEGASKDAQVLRVRLEHTNPDDAQALLTSIIGSYEAFLVDTSESEGTKASKLFNDERIVLEEKLAELNAEYKDFVKNAPALIISSPNGDSVNPHQLQILEIEKQLADLRLKRTELRSRIKITRDTLDDKDMLSRQKITVFDPEDVDRLSLMISVDKIAYDQRQTERSGKAGVQYGQYLLLMRKLATDKLKMGENHPQVAKTKAEIARIEQLLDIGEAGTADADQVVDVDRLVSLYLGLLENDLKHIESRSKELSILLQEESSKATEMIGLQIDDAELKREMARTEQLYNTVVSRLSEVDLQKDYGAFATELISPPELGLKSWPKIPLLIALGTLLGTIGGAAIAVAAELSDRSFRGHEDIEKELGTSVLTHLPVMLPRDLRNVKPNSSLAPQLVAFHQPKSHHAEAVRNLRASVYFRTNELETPVIQITSPNPGDGKSTMTANLAVSIAQTNKRVLLIECDMRRPSQHSIFGFDRDRKGLADVLKRDCSIDDATFACSEIPNLFMIPSGGIPDNPAELLALPDFSQFLSVVRDDYDFILIDSPPIAPVSDAAVIASLVDRVVLALTLSKNARSAAASAQESLVSHGADLMGLVVSKYGGTNSYGYTYGGYGYESGKKYEKSGYYTYS